MSEWRDSSAPIRAGEELDAAKLRSWLQGELGTDPGELEITQFPSGYSNLTYSVRAGEQQWVLRRPPFGSKVKSAHDMGREYRILSALHRFYSKVPRPVAHCEDDSVLGAPFYLMERVQGIILRPKMPKGMIPDPETMGGIARSLVSSLAELHAVDVKEVGLGDFGRPEGYIQRQVEGWAKRYEGSKTDDIPEMIKVANWLSENRPPESGAALIHNDFKYDNLVLAEDDWTRITAVLDWEMATVGDPLMDLGTSLGYWIHPGDPEMMQKLSLSPTSLPGNPSRADIVQQYAEETGRDPGNGVFYYAYGLFKIGVIVQQIYYRFVKGLTQDKRFAQLGFVVRGCAMSAALAIDKGRIDDLY